MIISSVTGDIGKKRGGKERCIRIRRQKINKTGWRQFIYALDTFTHKQLNHAIDGVIFFFKNPFDYLKHKAF
jgi:hypothetical protein